TERNKQKAARVPVGGNRRRVTKAVPADALPTRPSSVGNAATTTPPVFAKTTGRGKEGKEVEKLSLQMTPD
ncbi:hypothetical protein BaRGS_00032542, partial [Batillaria attramentaria]